MENNIFLPDSLKSPKLSSFEEERVIVFNQSLRPIIENSTLFESTKNNKIKIVYN